VKQICAPPTKSHRRSFRVKNFIQVGFFRRDFFAGKISIMINTLFHKGFVRFVRKFNCLASQLQKHFRPAAFLFAPE